MKTKQKLGLFIATFLSASLLYGAVSACERGGHRGDDSSWYGKGHQEGGHWGGRDRWGSDKGSNRAKGGRRLQRMMDYLGLDNDQRQQFEYKQEQFRAEIKQNRGDSKDARKELHDLVISDNYDEKQIQEIAEKMSDNSIERIVARSKLMRELYELLTEEQKKKMEKWHKDRQQY